MISRIWSGSSQYYLLLLPFSWIYGLITTIIKLSYRWGWRKVYKFPLPIIVIGNLTSGGNGKTPMVLWLITQLQLRGWLVGVISRGYGGRSKHYPIIINSTTHSNECGDEPLLIWQRTGIPVAVSPRRSDAVAALLQFKKLDIIISDDGLQHYALNRDIEWVVIGNHKNFGNGWWLPAGPMRELASRLNSVQEIIINGKTTKPKEISMKLRLGKVINLLNGKSYPLKLLQSVIAIAGIGNPCQFFATLRANGLVPIKEIAFSDHQIYFEKTLTSLTLNHENLLMTEKDAVKCKYFAHINWWYVKVDAILSRAATKKIIAPVEKIIRKYHQTNKNILVTTRSK